MSLLGFVLPAATIGLGSLLLKPQRGLFTSAEVGPPEALLLPQTVVEENHVDELHITEHPVEYGSKISDHAFKQPAEVTIRWLWSDSPSNPSGLLGAAMSIGATIGGPLVGNILAAGQTIDAVDSILSGNDPRQSNAIYEKMLKLQSDRTLMDIYTGKRFYTNMIIKSIMVQTDQKTERTLAAVIRCQQIIIARTKVVKIGANANPEAQANPEKTSPMVDSGTQQLQSTENVEAP